MFLLPESKDVMSEKIEKTDMFTNRGVSLFLV